MRLTIPVILAASSVSFAQQSKGSDAEPAGMAPIAAVPVPNDLELNKLVWTTMLTVDGANQAGNYSVLRDISAPGFQINNDSAKLAQVFAGLRASRIDLANSLLLAPTYTSAPLRPSADLLELKGYFGLRPTSIDFDLVYQWVNGRWRIYGVNILPRTLANVMPNTAQPAQGRR